MQRWKPSVTVAAIIEQGGKFLLVEEETADGLKLNNPAGHLDPGESPEQGCVREAFEETACRFLPEALVGVYLARTLNADSSEDITYMRFAYCGTVGEPEPGRTLDHGIVRTLWMTPDEIRASIARHRSPLLVQCMEDYLAGRRYALGLVFTHPSNAGH